MDESALESTFDINITQDDIENITKGYMSEISEAITADNSKAQKVIINNLSTITKNILNDYIKRKLNRRFG